MTDRDPELDDVLELRCADAVELVTEYLDDALSEQDLARFVAHLADCEGCTIFVDQLLMTIKLTSETGRRQVELMPPGFDELLAQLRGRAEREAASSEDTDS